MIIARLVTLLFIRVSAYRRRLLPNWSYQMALLGPNIYQMAPKMLHFSNISRPRSVSDAFSELVNMSTIRARDEATRG